jgi:hypothetical protein
MVWHAVYLQHSVIIVLKDCCNVLVKPFFPVVTNKCTSKFNRKYKLDMDLCIGIRHIDIINMQFNQKTPIVPTERKILMIFFYPPDVPMEHRNVILMNVDFLQRDILT